jgi:hypothetical protein
MFACGDKSETTISEEYCWAMTGGGAITLQPARFQYVWVWI